LKTEEDKSFSKQIKAELLNIKPDSDEEALAFLLGIVRSIGNVQFKEDNVTLSVVSDVEGLYDYLNEILKILYGDFAEVEIVEKSVINTTIYYDIVFPQDKTLGLLNDIGLLIIEKSGYKMANELDTHLLNTHEKIVAFLRAVFLTSSTNSIRISKNAAQKTTSGYHLEFTSHSSDFLNQLAEILAQNNIVARKIERKKLFVLYLKEAQAISDLLAFMGASNSVLRLQNEMVTRQRRNFVNRQVNFLSANISKTVGANAKQLEAIEIISSTIGIDSLPEQLEEVALLRLANQEESLSDLVKLSTINLTKSGINHRMRKIIKIAEELKEQEE
jgi:DNA-binding protein WhiA